MQIFAKTWNSAVNSSKTIILDVEPWDLIEDVKDELRHKLEISPLVDVQLRFCSKILNNDQTLSSCNVRREANIDVFLRKMSTSIPPSSVGKNDDSELLPDYSEDSDDDIENTNDNSILPDYSEDGDDDIENTDDNSILPDYSEDGDDDIENTDDKSILPDYSEDSDDVENPLITTDDGEDSDDDIQNIDDSEDNDAQTTQNSEDNEKDTKIPNENECNAENGAVMLVTTNDVDSKKGEIEDVFQKFHDDFGKLMTSKTSKEIELRATKFKEKHDENVIISEKISDLKKSHYNNAKEIKKEMEEIKKLRDTSLLTCIITQSKKEKIDAKIKELQEESLELEKLLNSEHRKIKEKEDAHETWKKEKEMENGNLTKKIDCLQKRKLINTKESEELYNTDFEFKKKKTIVNETLVDFISKSIDEKLKDLECPVCFVAAETPIFMCSSFHLICKDCLPSMTSCPVCRGKYPQHPPRHRFAEKMDQELKKLSMERQGILDAI